MFKHIMTVALATLVLSLAGSANLDKPPVGRSASACKHCKMSCKCACKCKAQASNCSCSGCCGNCCGKGKGA